MLSRSDSQESERSDEEQTIGDAAKHLPPVDDKEIERTQRTFSMLIDRTCEEGPQAHGNIFESTGVPEDWHSFLFRSLVPSNETVRQYLEHELPRENLRPESREGGGVKYAFKVWDRRTNRLTFEQMPSYHKYGMRLLFSGPIQRKIMQKRAIKRFFNRETKRIGKAFDDPKSCKHIPSFVKMYNINLNELEKPNVADYRTFNQFFYRKLKPHARPIADRMNSNVVVSAADCRLILFDNINDATRIWIKGHRFSLEHLFDDRNLAKEFEGGSIAIFRLAPVDYHRFHSPISGRIGSNKKSITGTYYTVNPIAIRENLDVLTRNQRTMITIENQTLGKVAFVAIGALLVGSVNFTVDTEQEIEKGDELGYFAYGGSTVVVVFKAGMIQWDDDVQHHANNSMETLVQMGERIGQVRSEEERRTYLDNLPKSVPKYQTISQFSPFFPTRDTLN